MNENNAKKISGDSGVVTRFAPSPTGLLHAGNYRTALFSYIFARQNNGSFILRIEDTDKERSKKEFEQNILESLEWLGLSYDKFFKQSERREEHKKALKQLVENGYAYVSKETAKDNPNITLELIRFKNPNSKVSFNDLIRGHIEFDTTELGDFVIAKGFDEPLFHLAVVKDDFDMGITHIIRGEDHISNTPRQILIARALGAPQPVYAHLPIVLSADRSKLSKRKGAKPITQYKQDGFLPEAVVNYLALLGWHPSGTSELLGIEELIEKFDITKIQKSGAIFDEEKLRWFNKEYLKRLPLEVVEEEISKALLSVRPNIKPDHSILHAVSPLFIEHISNFGEIEQSFLNDQFLYFFEKPAVNLTKIIWKQSTVIETINHLKFVIGTLDTIVKNDWNREVIKTTLWPYAEKEGKGNVLWPMRFALTGQEKSPDPFTVSEILGKEETISRLKQVAQDLTA